MKTHDHAAQMAEALRDLFENCVMVHKHWGDGSNAREADAAQVDAQAALAAWDRHNAPAPEQKALL
jgi:dsRNA-specific ribonuclease